MTNLKAVKVGQNKFCGPAVLSILTGRDTDECAQAIRAINKQYIIAGVYLSDLLKAANSLGFDTHKIYGVDGISLYRLCTQIVNTDGIYIVTIPHHFVVLEVKDRKIYFCDNHTKEPIPAASSARLMIKVEACYKVEKNENFREPEPSPVLVDEYISVEKYTVGDIAYDIFVFRHKVWSDGNQQRNTFGSIHFNNLDELEAFKAKLMEMK